MFDLDEDDEIYEGYGKVNSAFPYRQLNGYTRELHEKDVKTAVLENEYLKAVFLTESVSYTHLDVYKRQILAIYLGSSFGI